MTGIRVHVHGAGGRMGRACVEAVAVAADMELCGTTGRADDLAERLRESRPEVVVEFTVPGAVEANVIAIASFCRIPVDISPTQRFKFRSSRSASPIARSMLASFRICMKNSSTRRPRISRNRRASPGR